MAADTTAPAIPSKANGSADNDTGIIKPTEKKLGSLPEDDDRPREGDVIPESVSKPGVQNVQDAQGAAEENGSTGEPAASAHLVKTEPSSTILEKVPINVETDLKPGLSQLDGADTFEEHPTPKKVASLKNQGNSRASSTDRSSPANSTKAPAKRAPAKKGIGRKTAPKKRKLNNEDNESVGSRRSQTPVPSRSFKAGTKKQNPASLANSPAPETKKKGGKKAVVEEDEEEDEEEDSDSGEIFCICRKPDNHTWMIACDGGCEDWFHGKCVNIDPRDADLIEKYICKSPNSSVKCRTKHSQVRAAKRTVKGGPHGSRCVD
jgi:COMPASS component SPP1